MSKQPILAALALTVALWSTPALAAPGLGYDTWLDRIVTRIVAFFDWSEPSPDKDDGRAGSNGDG